MFLPTFILSKSSIPQGKITYMHYKLSWFFFHLDPKDAPTKHFSKENLEIYLSLQGSPLGDGQKVSQPCFNDLRPRTWCMGLGHISLEFLLPIVFHSSMALLMSSPLCGKSFLPFSLFVYCLKTQLKQHLLQEAFPKPQATKDNSFTLPLHLYHFTFLTIHWWNFRSLLFPLDCKSLQSRGDVFVFPFFFFFFSAFLSLAVNTGPGIKHMFICVHEIQFNRFPNSGHHLPKSHLTLFSW